MFTRCLSNVDSHYHQCKKCGSIFTCDDEYCQEFGGRECMNCSNFVLGIRVFQ